MKRFFKIITWPLEAYYQSVQKADRKLFDGSGVLFRVLDLAVLLVLVYLFWYRLTH